MRAFMTKAFSRFAKRERLPAEALCEAMRRASRGLVDADLGGGVIKQRIARENAGRSGGYRSIILFREGSCCFFVYGYAKSGRANIRKDELHAFRLLARRMLELNGTALEALIGNGTITEVHCDAQTIRKRRPGRHS